MTKTIAIRGTTIICLVQGGLATIRRAPRQLVELLALTAGLIVALLATFGWEPARLHYQWLMFALLAALVRQHARATASLRQGQEQYRSVVEDQSELICRFKADGTYTFVNGAYCRYFQRTADELVGQTLWQFIPVHEQAATHAFLATITPDRPVASREHEVIGAGGELRWLRWTDRGSFDDRGRLLEYQAVGHDITERKRAEEEHRQLVAQKHVAEVLQEVDRRKDEFLAMLAHELRNPLPQSSWPPRSSG